MIAMPYSKNLTCARLRQAGFTLVEMMLAVAVAGIIAAAVYVAYLSQQRSYLAQEQVVEMQQNLRAAMQLITSEILKATLDPWKTAAFSVTACQPGQFSFLWDANLDGIIGADEQIDLGFSASAGADSDRNGIPDAGGTAVLSLGRQINGGGGYQPVADNIQALEFNCLDLDGNATTDVNKARIVQISILARASRPDQKMTNTAAYSTASGATWGPYNDNYRRRLLQTDLLIRNKGL
jgi:type IV pilus assembly protein PilW